MTNSIYDYNILHLLSRISSWNIPIPTAHFSERYDNLLTRKCAPKSRVNSHVHVQVMDTSMMVSPTSTTDARSPTCRTRHGPPFWAARPPGSARRSARPPPSSAAPPRAASPPPAAHPADSPPPRASQRWPAPSAGTTSAWAPPSALCPCPSLLTRSAPLIRTHTWSTTCNTSF